MYCLLTSRIAFEVIRFRSYVKNDETFIVVRFIDKRQQVSVVRELEARGYATSLSPCGDIITIDSHGFSSIHAHGFQEIGIKPTTFEEWCLEFDDELTCIFAESGADRELDFDRERMKEAMYEQWQKTERLNLVDLS